MTAAEQHVRSEVHYLCLRYRAESEACEGVPTAELEPGIVARILRENEILRGKLREIERIAREGV